MHHRFPLAAYRVSLPAVVAVLLAQAACGGDGGGGSSDVGTLAYVVTSCHEEAGAATLQQELRIFPGAGETVTVPQAKRPHSTL